jgi:predicted nucleic acid-binding protein
VSTVFLDTVGLIALWDSADQWHHDARHAYAAIRETRFVGITTDAVLIECGNAAARRPYRRDVNQLRQQLVANGELIAVTDSDWEQAWLAYDRGDAGDAGIVDHASFAVMRRLGLRQAFTNDRHFAAAGFETLF